jgi:hypothetical protein
MASLVHRVIRVGKRRGQRVGENGGCLVEGDPMFRAFLAFL